MRVSRSFVSGFPVRLYQGFPFVCITVSRSFVSGFQVPLYQGFMCLCIRISRSLISGFPVPLFQGFPFLYNQIRDCINIRQTCNLIFSLCRWNERLAVVVRCGLLVGQTGGVGRATGRERWTDTCVGRTYLRMACLHERFSAYLSPDTVTGDDGRQQPETMSRRLSAEVEPVPMVSKK